MGLKLKRKGGEKKNSFFWVVYPRPQKFQRTPPGLGKVEAARDPPSQQPQEPEATS